MLKEMSELMGVSGDEGRVREYLRDKIAKYVTEITEDPYGNLIVRKGKPSKPRILVAAHMDEVGLMITGIEKSGLLKFHAIGMMPGVLMAKRVLIGKENVPGVIGHKPIHLTKKEEMEKMPDVKDLFIDIGVSSKDAASNLVGVGDYASFDTQFSENGDIIAGKAFDDRIGCFILLQLIKKSDLPLYYAFTVQEEVGLRGARIAAYRVNPDVALAVDTTASGEWPTEKDVAQYPVIGKGPIITIADRSAICDEKVVGLIRSTADEMGIPYQMKKPMIGGTDAGAMHLIRTGVRAAVVSIAARYIHSPLAVASKKDIRSAIKLIDHSIQKIMRKEKLWA
jgi:endoglucanase